MTNIHTAVFAPGSRSVILDPLWQWDYGQVLKFSGLDLPDAYEVHFSNCPNGESTTALGNAAGVPIPDMYFVSGQPIYAWVYLHTSANDGETVYTVTIPINRRARPTADPPSEREQDIFTAGVALLSAKIDDIDNVARYAAEAKEAAQDAEQAYENMISHPKLLFYSEDIPYSASGRTFTMNDVSIVPGAIYEIATNNIDGVIKNLRNPGGVDLVHIFISSTVKSGSLTIEKSYDDLGVGYTVNETVYIDSTTREILLYCDPNHRELRFLNSGNVPGEITAGENVTIVSQALRRKGSVVQLQARITASSELTDPLTAADTLFTVPSGFRPAESTTVLGWRTGDYTTLPVGIGTNGQCKPFGSASLAPGVSAIINTSYIIS